MAVPVRGELAAALADYEARKKRAILRPVQLGRERLQARAERIARCATPNCDPTFIDCLADIVATHLKYVMTPILRDGVI